MFDARTLFSRGRLHLLNVLRLPLRGAPSTSGWQRGVPIDHDYRFEHDHFDVIAEPK